MERFHHGPILKKAIGFCCAVLMLQAAQGQEVRLHGAVALAKTLETQKSAIEGEAGVKLQIVSNGAGRGLADLCGGQADIALLAGPMKLVSEAMNAEKAGSVDVSGLKETPVGSTKLVFVTHPSAGVKALTAVQMKDVLTGKVTNWKEVGGADVPIKVVLAFGADGARLTTQSELLGGAEYAKGSIIRNSSKDVPVVVAQLPGACSVLSAQNVDSSVVSVSMEKEVKIPWSLVVKGEPSGNVKKAIEAITKLVK